MTRTVTGPGRNALAEPGVVFKEIRAALVHHWFLVHSGGERVCDALCDILDRPDLFTLVCDPDTLTPNLRRCELTTSFIQSLPRTRAWYRYYAPFYPLAVESLDLEPYDLVVSSDASAVKGVLTRPEPVMSVIAIHPCAMPGTWPTNTSGGRVFFKRTAFTLLMHYLRQWDLNASRRVDYFVANSENVRRRIRKYYGREARVIYPPCDVDRFQLSDRTEDYYLFVGRLVGYKRADLAIRACSQSKRRLLVVGGGPEESRLKSLAASCVEFMGQQPDDRLAELYARCRALIFPAEEDFGLVPVEAQAAGRPVVAYGRGGAVETVLPDRTGVFFQEQTVDALLEALKRLEGMEDRFDPEVIRNQAGQFGRKRFIAEMERFLVWCMRDHAEGASPRQVTPWHPPE